MRQRLLVQFGDELRELRTRAGRPSYAELTRLDPTLRRSTMSDVLQGKSSPSAEFVRAFVAACIRFAELNGHPIDGPEADVAFWRRRWRELSGAVEQAGRPQQAKAMTRPRMRTEVPRQLRPANRVFVGRTAERARLTALSRSTTQGAPPVAVINGMAGAGKTSLALRWAHDAAGDFPDGQLYADLGGYSTAGSVDPAFILDGFVYALAGSHTRTDDVGQLAAQFRSLMAGRRMIVVLDDARDAAQVRALLPATAETYVIVTSRTKLPELGLEPGAQTVSLAPMDVDDGVTLLKSLVPDRVNADQRGAQRLVELCGGLPLALRLAAQTIAQGQTLADECDRLESLTGRVAHLDAALGQSTERLRAVLAASCGSVSEQAGRLLRAFAAHPGSEFSAEAAAALGGVRSGVLSAGLDELEQANLLDQVDHGRYRLHELVRAHLAGDASGIDLEARARVFSWYLHSAHAAAEVVLPQRGSLPIPDLVPGVQPSAFESFGEADSWFRRELENLLAVTRAACDAGEYEVATALPNVALSYLNLRKPWNAWLALFETAVLAAQANGDGRALAGSHNALGIARRELGQQKLAEDHLRRAAAAYEQAGESVGASMALNNLGTLFNDEKQFGEAANVLSAALDLLGDTADPWRRGIVLNNLAYAHALDGDATAALGLGEQALAICRELDDAAGEGCALTALGEAKASQGDLRAAADYFRSAIERSTVANDDYDRARTERRLAEVLTEIGDVEEAQAAAASALTIFDRLSDPAAHDVRKLVAQIAAATNDAAP